MAIRMRTALFVSICCMFILTIVLAIVNPTKPVIAMQQGINSPIIGLEMAWNSYQIWNLIGDPQTLAGASARAAFALGTWIDFGYIFAYSMCYLFLNVLLMIRHNVHRGFMFAIAAVIALTAIADVIENSAIFKILEMGSESLIEPYVNELVVFTRVKWLLLGMAGLPAVALFRREQRRAPAFILTVVFALGGLSVVKPYAPEIMTLFLAFFWVYLFMKLLPLKNRWWA